MRRTVLDHVAVATRVLTDGWDLFSGLLGGTWLYGGNSAGFWWGQLQYRTGPKIELISPTGGPGAAFLERFLTARGPGPHHLNFGVTDIAETLGRVRSLGIVPVGVQLDSPRWKEAFLHPRDAYGIVIQVAQQSGSPPPLAAPSDLPLPGAPSDFALIEVRVDDIDGAVSLYTEALDGELVTRDDVGGEPAAELAWQSGARIRLLLSTAGGGTAPPQPAVRGLSRLHFSQDASALSSGELARAAALSLRLGVPLAFP